MPGHTPEGWQSVTVRLFTADTGGLVAFLRAVFDAEGEHHADRPAEMRIGDSIVMVSSGRDPMPAFLYVYVADTDETYRRAVAAGAQSLEAPQDMFYGDRRAMVQDDWGNIWQIATRVGTGN